MTAQRSDTPPSTRITPASLYQVLREEIASGALDLGAPLIETQLAERFSVSRTPVREALMRLEQDGLVNRQGREFVVRERSQEEILDIYATRIVLEATVARVAAARRTTLDIAQMRSVAQHLREMVSPTPAEMAAANRRFHRTVWRAGHNESLTDLLSRLDMHLARYPATTLAIGGRWDEANQQHLDMVAAIEARNEDQAARLAADHFTQARDLRLQLWAQNTF